MPTTGSTGATGSPATPANPSSAIVPARPATVTTTVIPGSITITPSPRLVSGLDVPWGIAFFPDGDALVSERDLGRLLRVTPGGQVTVLSTVAGVVPTSEGGLLGVAVSPTYPTDHLVFAYLTTATDNRVVAGTLADFADGTTKAILTGIPFGDRHDGGRIAFGPDGRLYVTTGETGVSELAQSTRSLGGKILRINPDGSIPKDDPFPGSPIWSYGHRNVEGLAWDDQGRLWASEFGDQTWDEINRITPGHDYGWPAAEGTSDLPGMTNPSAVFATDVASPSGMAFADHALWLGALQGETMWKVPVMRSGQLGTPVAVRLAAARTRTVVTAPDGTLWVTTSNTDGRAIANPGDDSIFRFTP